MAFKYVKVITISTVHVLTSECHLDGNLPHKTMFKDNYKEFCKQFMDNFLLKCRYCDEGMIEAVTSLIWSAPRLQSDVQELRVVRKSQTKCKLSSKLYTSLVNLLLS